MKIIRSLEEIKSQASIWRTNGQKLSLVPTMGYFHQGHLSLMKYAKQYSDRLVVSLFVNPIQFGPAEDLDAYPRDFERDRELASNAGTDVLFCPSTVDMYPHGFQTNVTVKRLSQGLCGDDRPGHFDGVATVVTKLFNLVQPHLAVFGEKDFQQLAIIRQLVTDLNMDVKVAGHPVVRERDGLAMSSRNKYLDSKERKEATCLFTAIQLAKKIVAHNKTARCAEIEDQVVGHINNHRGCAVEYVAIIDQNSLQRTNVVHEQSRLVLAVKVNNKVRLIDNAPLMD